MNNMYADIVYIIKREKKSKVKMEIGVILFFSELQWIFLHLTLSIIELDSWKFFLSLLNYSTFTDLQ